MERDTGLACIVLVNWNGWQDTTACVESCRLLDYSPRRIIVVDNASTDDSIPRLRELGEDVTLLESAENRGFAAGCNVGIAEAVHQGARYVWLLNNDTTVEPETLSGLVEALEQAGSAGIAGSKIYYFDRPDTLWFAGGIVARGWGWTRHRGEGERDAGQYNQTEEMDYATGASLLVRSEVVNEIGMMDEGYFMYWEEVDWCERARSAGWGVVYAPASRVWHKVGASTPDDRANIKWRYEGRNRIRFYRRNRPSLMLWVAAVALANATYLALRCRPRGGSALARGVLDGLRGKSEGAYAD